MRALKTKKKGAKTDCLIGGICMDELLGLSPEKMVSDYHLLVLKNNEEVNSEVFY